MMVAYLLLSLAAFLWIQKPSGYFASSKQSILLADLSVAMYIIATLTDWSWTLSPQLSRQSNHFIFWYPLCMIYNYDVTWWLLRFSLVYFLLHNCPKYVEKHGMEHIFRHLGSNLCYPEMGCCRKIAWFRVIKLEVSVFLLYFFQLCCLFAFSSPCKSLSSPHCHPHFTALLLQWSEGGGWGG